MSLKTMPNSPSISRAYPEAVASVECGNGPPTPDRVSAASVSQRRDRYSDTASRVLELVGKKHRTVAPWHGGVNATTATGRARRGASCFALSLSPTRCRYRPRRHIPARRNRNATSEEAQKEKG